MKASRFSDSQIIAILKQAEGGSPVPELCREYGFSSATFYKWRAKFGGMDASLMARLKTRRRKSSPQENVRRRTPQSRDRQRGARKKVVKPSQRREMAQQAVQHRGVSIGLACHFWHQPNLLSLPIPAICGQ